MRKPYNRTEYFPVPVSIRLAPDTGSWLKQRAHEHRMTPSAFIRRMLEEAATRDLTQKQTAEAGDAA
jgi:hypothetical protein